MSNLYQRNGIWWARFKVAGEEHRFSLFTRVRADAERALKAERARITQEVRFGIRGPVSWPEAVVAWDESIGRAIAPTTKTRYVVSLAQVRPWLDDKHLHQIDAACLRTMVKERQRGGASNATIRRDLTAISSVLAHAVDEEWIDANAAAALPRKRIPERRDPIVLPTEEAIAAMIAASPPRFADMIAFARETGMRQEEIASLEWTAIDARNGCATPNRTKGMRLRTVTMSPLALAIVNRQPQMIGSKTVFRHDGSSREAAKRDNGRRKPVGAPRVPPGRYASPSSKFGAIARRVAQKAAREGWSFTPFRFHDLRHLFAVEFLRQRRGSIYDLQRELGHASIKTTELYLDFLTPQEAQAARGRVAQNPAHDQRLAADRRA